MRLHVIGAALALAALAFSDVTSVGPSTASIGTVLTVDGLGFGATKAPKVELVPVAGGKPIVLKVEKGFTDAHLTAVLKKAKRGQTGLFDLRVSPKGGTPLVEPASVTVDVGQIATVTPATVAAGASITIDGTLFGTKKGKVKVGGKAAKVTSWTPTQIVATLSKKTPAGAQDLVVTNKLGDAVEAGAVQIGDGGGGGGDEDPFLRARLFRDPILASGADLSIAAKGTGFVLTGTGSRGPNDYTVVLDLSNVDFTALGVGDFIRVDPVLLEVTLNGATTWRAGAGDADVLVRHLRAGIYVGDFDARLPRASGAAEPDPLPVAATAFQIVLQ